MSKKNFDIYIDLSSKKLSIAAFEKFDSHNIFFKEYYCETNLNKNKLNFENVRKTIEKNILEIEKKNRRIFRRYIFDGRNARIYFN